MKLPKVKKPSMPKRGGSGGSAKMPGFVDDLYRDLRDRRLLLPAVLLIAAIVAVPALLTTAKEEPPAPLAFTPPEGAEAVAPAVLAEQPIGVRDYRERLDELKSKNPFASNFDFPGDDAASGELAQPPASAPADPPSTGGLPSGDTGASDVPAPDAGPSPAAAGDGGSSQSELLILAPRIDVRAGRPGEQRWIRDVEIGDILPHPRKAPIAIFLGATENLKRASFLVSGDVTATSGDGKCSPSPQNCEFLRLAEGDRQRFVFGPNEAVRVITVKSIREEIVDRRKVESK